MLSPCPAGTESKSNGVPDFLQQLHRYNRHPMVGEPLLRKAQIVDVVEKQGATPLKLCKVEYSYFGGNSAAVRRRSADRCDPIFTETQTIVYIASGRKSPLATKNLLEDADGLRLDAVALCFC